MPKTKIKGKSVGNQTQEDWESHLQEVMSPAELDNYLFFVDRFESAREQREQPHRFFDDMSFTDDYFSNENAKNTYLRAKLNDSEVRVNTGLTEKKIETVINELLSLNLQHEVRAFDKDDNLMVELGDDMTDLVTRTNKIEEDDDVMQESIIELMTQRAVFVREVIDERKTRNKTRTKRIIRKELISGLKVFLGDITIPAHRFDEQPYIFIYDRLHWRTAEQMFGHMEKWKNVQQGFNQNFSTRTGAYAWRLGNLEDDEVEVLAYVSLPDNEVQLFINGVMMLIPGEDESKIPWGYDSYNMRMVTLKSLSPDFAYGKPLTASAKTLQGLSNETLRLMIRKWHQALEPPLATVAGKTFDREIWDPGAISQGLRKNDFERLIDHQGVTNSEFAMMDFIEKKTQEFIGSSDVHQGLTTGERTTATEVLNAQRNATKQLGLAVLAVTRLKRELTKLRIYSILDEHFKPNGKKKDPLTKETVDTFTGFTIEDAKIDKERVGTKRVQLMNRDLTPEEIEEIYEHEQRLEKLGLNFRFRGINVNTLKNMFVNWFVVVTPQQREGSALDKIMFQDQMAQGAAVSQLTGAPLNGPVIQETFERKWRAKDWFQKQAPAQLQQMNPEMEAEQGDNRAKAQDMLNKLSTLGNSQLSNGIKGGQQAQRPSVNTALGQVS